MLIKISYSLNKLLDTQDIFSEIWIRSVLSFIFILDISNLEGELLLTIQN